MQPSHAPSSVTARGSIPRPANQNGCRNESSVAPEGNMTSARGRFVLQTVSSVLSRRASIQHTITRYAGSQRAGSPMSYAEPDAARPAFSRRISVNPLIVDKRPVVNSTGAEMRLHRLTRQVSCGITLGCQAKPYNCGSGRQT